MEHPSASVVAEALGLMVHSSRAATTHRITGFIGGLGVVVRAPHGHRTWEQGPLEIKVDTFGAVPRSLEVGRTATLVVRSTYDESFDREIAVRGDALVIAALFNHNTRHNVRAILGSIDLTVGSGVVQFERAWPIGDDYAPFVITTVHRMIEFAKLLSIDEASIPKRLVKNALEDHDRTARKRSLELLLENFPDAPEVSAEDRLRAMAAKHLGEAGARWAREVLETTTADEPLRMDALEHLIERFPDSLPETPWLLREVPRAAPRMAVLLARALGIRRDGSAESGLIDFLKHHPRTDVKVAAAEALAETGTYGAIEPLYHHAKRFFGDPALRAASRDAIERIKARLGASDERGGLSLIADGTGELSLAVDPKGSLSVAADPEEDDRGSS